MSDSQELEKLSAIADERLDVAEDFAWLVATLLAGMVHMKWGGWLLPIGGGAAAYFVLTYRFRRRAAIAEDQYFRAAHLGKYSAILAQGLQR